MAQFPRTEAEIAALAGTMATGLTAATTDFPAPPVAPADLTTALTNYTTARDAAATYQSAAQATHRFLDLRLPA